jgi:1,4-dihydroxy-2-naphthoate octaprenyltransferase
VGGKTKPWGALPKRKILSIAISALVIVFTIGLYYAFLDSPILFPIGIIEGFFLFAYNLELFGGKFHNNISTVISWGILPVFAGSAIQTNSISIETIILSGISAGITYFLITTSRKYKALKRDGAETHKIKNKEIILKTITLVVITTTVLFFILQI